MQSVNKLHVYLVLAICFFYYWNLHKQLLFCQWVCVLHIWYDMEYRNKHIFARFFTVQINAKIVLNIIS